MSKMKEILEYDVLGTDLKVNPKEPPTLKLNLMREQYHTNYCYHIMCIEAPSTSYNLPSLQYLVTSSADKTIKFLNLRTNEIELSVPTKSNTHCLGLIKNGEYMIGCDHDGVLMIYKIEYPENKIKCTMFREIQAFEPTSCLWKLLSFDDGDKAIVTAAEGKGKGEVKIVSNNFSQYEYMVELKQVYKHPADTWSNICRLKKAARYVVIGCYNPNILVKIDLYGDESPVKFSEVHTHSIPNVQSFLVNDGIEERIVSSAWDKKTVVWDSKYCTALREINHSSEGYFQCGMLIQNKFLLMGTENGSIYSMNLQSESEKDLYSTKHLTRGQKSKLFRFCWVPKQSQNDPIRIACSSQDFSFAFYELTGFSGGSNENLKVDKVELDISNNNNDKIVKEGVDELDKFLRSIEMEHYYPILKDASVVYRDLPFLEESDLEDLITRRFHLKRFLSEVKKEFKDN